MKNGGHVETKKLAHLDLVMAAQASYYCLRFYHALDPSSKKKRSRLPGNKVSSKNWGETKVEENCTKNF